MTVMEAIEDIHSIVRTKTTTDHEIGLTTPMDGLDSSRGPGCVTPAPKNFTGFSNTLLGLNVNYGL